MRYVIERMGQSTKQRQREARKLLTKIPYQARFRSHDVAASGRVAQAVRCASLRAPQRGSDRRGITSWANSSMPSVLGKSMARTMTYWTPASM